MSKPSRFSCSTSAKVISFKFKIISGRFQIENDTKLSSKDRDLTKAAQDDQDYNNKMFLVVRSLKVGSEKVVSSTHLIFCRTIL